MAYIVVLNPLILGAGVDGDGGSLPIAALAAGTALVAGLMTILMGVVGRFPLALAAGLGVNALVAYEIAPEMTWADAMGLVVIEGVLIGDPGADRAADRGVPRGADPAEDRDRRRHRPVPDDHRAGGRRVRAADAGRGRHHGPGGAGHRRQAGQLAGAGLRARPAAHAGAVRPAGQGRDPDRHPGHHGLRDHRGGDRQGRAVVRRRQAQPEGLVAERAGAAGQDRGPAGPVAARQVQRASTRGAGPAGSS